MVFVSHDRYFIDKLATRIFEVEDGRVHVFPGNYEDYLWRKGGGGQAPAATESETEPAPAEPEENGASATAGSADQRLNPIRLRQMKERRGEIEEEVTRLEAEIADCEAALGNFVNAEETRRVSACWTRAAPTSKP